MHQHHTKISDGKVWLALLVSDFWRPVHPITVFVLLCLVFLYKFLKHTLKIIVENLLECVQIWRIEVTEEAVDINFYILEEFNVLLKEALDVNELTKLGEGLVLNYYLEKTAQSLGSFQGCLRHI